MQYLYNNKVIYIRNENNPCEHRTPIVPDDIPKLILMGFDIFVETSQHRIFSDTEYKTKGAIITNKPWNHPIFNDCLIVGLKEIAELENLNNHKHLYFSHSYKKQNGFENILQKFAKSCSIIYDFEYFLDDDNKRLISFGFYAGIVGCVLGLLQYLASYHYQIRRLKYRPCML